MRVIYKIADQILSRAFYALFFLVPLSFTAVNFELFEFPKMLLTYALTVIIVSAWATKSILAGKFIFRRTLLDLPLLLFLLSQLLSTFYSIDPHTSIWGYYSRSNGGLLSVISYLFLYWAFVSNMDYKKTRASITYLLSSGAIVAIWGTSEHFGKSPSCLILRGSFDTTCWIQDVQERVFATLGQPNWMAAWLVALAPLIWSFALKSKLKTQNSKVQLKTQNWKWIAISGFLFAALLFTKSRSGFLGFAVANFVFWIGLFVYKIQDTRYKILKPFVLLVTCYVLLIAIFGSPWTSPIPSQRVTSDESRVAESGTALETGGTESGEIRKIVWKGAVNIWGAYPIFGSGVETFAYSYYQFRPIEHNLTSEWDFLYNKAHDEYLNFLATTGVVGLATYLLLIAAAIGLFGYWAVRMKFYTPGAQEPRSLIPLALAAGWASILVTNFFGFSVVATATLFFLFPAMAVVVTHDTAHITSSSRKSVKQSLAVTTVLLVTCYLLLQILRVWQADVFYAKAAELNNAGESLAAADAAEKAVSLRPDEPVYYNELAKGLGHAAVTLAEDDEATQAAALAKDAIGAQDRAVAISPMNLNFLKARASLFFNLTSVDPKYLEDATLTIEKAVEIAPTEPKVLYNLGVFYDRMGKTEQAYKVFKRVLELKPNYEDAQAALWKIQEQLP